MAGAAGAARPAPVRPPSHRRPAEAMGGECPWPPSRPAPRHCAPHPEDPPMQNAIGIIVATHGHLAEALVETAELILQRRGPLVPFTFLPDEDPQSASRRLNALVRKCDKGRGVIILVDLFGGTPGTLALAMLEEAAVEVVTGVNLPM